MSDRAASTIQSERIARLETMCRALLSEIISLRMLPSATERPSDGDCALSAGSHRAEPKGRSVALSVAATESALRDHARDLGLPIRAGGFVAEADAARLLDRAPGTLRNWRAQHCPIRWRKFAGRVCYALEDLAAFAEAASESPDE